VPVWTLMLVALPCQRLGTVALFCTIRQHEALRQPVWQASSCTDRYRRIPAHWLPKHAC
jgi:hypothetical protein